MLNIIRRFEQARELVAACRRRRALDPILDQTLRRVGRGWVGGVIECTLAAYAAAEAITQREKRESNRRDRAEAELDSIRGFYTDLGYPIAWPLEPGSVRRWLRERKGSRALLTRAARYRRTLN